MHDKKTRTIAIEWGIEDVLSERPDLTDDQAWHVLETCYFEHDANEGINWIVINGWAEYLYPKEDAA